MKHNGSLFFLADKGRPTTGPKDSLSASNGCAALGNPSPSQIGMAEDEHVTSSSACLKSDLTVSGNWLIPSNVCKEVSETEVIETDNYCGFKLRSKKNTE